MDAEIQAAFASLAKLVEDNSQSLQAEMNEMRSDMNRGFERVEAATRRNSTMLAGGTKAVAALNRWASQRDQLDSKRDREIRELRTRLAKVERALKQRRAS